MPARTPSQRVICGRPSSIGRKKSFLRSRLPDARRSPVRTNCSSAYSTGGSASVVRPIGVAAAALTHWRHLASGARDSKCEHRAREWVALEHA
eukprot:406632-Pyramimonas_sp.AAC.2